jgi:geranylgeranyl diphosphate synthase, type II
MDAVLRIEQALAAAVSAAERGCPQGLGAAARYAVFPGGARIRPRLCLAVAMACGDDRPQVTDAAAVAIELLHCASLVHDDLPCFDNADTRRGRPSVHRAFEERLAVLAGDGLIVLAFQVLARGAITAPERLPQVLTIVSEAVGMPNGIVAGQAWECERVADLQTYQRGKTGALFVAASSAGAAAAGHEPAPWRALGECLGESYQVADDIRDVVAEAEALGKPTGQDAALGRPSAVASLGLDGALARFEHLIEGAIESIPACPHQRALRGLVHAEARRLLPLELAERSRVGRAEFVSGHA